MQTITPTAAITQTAGGAMGVVSVIPVLGSVHHQRSVN